MARNLASQPATAQRILDWYDRHQRRFPWRAAPGERNSPYRVWLSEIMLQQTTTAAVVPYFEKFCRLWPDVKALADAEPGEIMSAWAGLGYYSRARNLHACARAVAERQGVFPDNETDLRALPGIGPYTAAAIAAIAFGRRAVVVDGNVERVVSRLFAIEEPVAAAKAEIRALTDRITPDHRCGDFAQAMMDIGATICQPKRADCLICPLQPECRAAATGKAEDYPRRKEKIRRPERRGAVFHLARGDGAVLVRSRPEKGLLGGMSELPGTDWSSDFEAGSALSFAPASANWRRLSGTVRHVFTHFALELTVFHAQTAEAPAAPGGFRWVMPGDMEREAWPSLMRKVLKKVSSHEH